MQFFNGSMFLPEENILQLSTQNDLEYFLAQGQLFEALTSLNVNSHIEQLLCTESWSNGYEGFIQNAWFNFTQFIKKIIRYVKTMLDHFLSGVNRKKRYLESKKIDIIRGATVNWDNLKRPVEGIYFKKDAFDFINTLCMAIQSFLTKVFNNPNIDLDSLSDFKKWNITFSNGTLLYNGMTGSLLSFFFQDTTLFNKQTESLERKKYDKNSILYSIDFLINILEYSNKKDYLFITFRSAMERLIHTASSTEDKRNIEKYKNSAKSIASLIAFMTEAIIRSANQMIKIIGVLETPESVRRSSSVSE